MIHLPGGHPVRMARRVYFHLPGQGYVEVPAGTICRAVDAFGLEPHVRKAIEASAKRDEDLRGRDMVLVHLLDGHRLVDFDDIEVMEGQNDGDAPGHRRGQRRAS